MHDGTVGAGDAWLKANIDDFVQWAMSNNSLLIVTWDEDDGKEGNHIATIFVGPMVKSGSYAQRITHFDVLRTIEALAVLAPLGEARSASTIVDIW
jgi:acid phosphatase